MKRGHTDDHSRTDQAFLRRAVLASANQADRIHIKKQRRRASLGCRFGIKEMRFPKGHFKGVHLRRVLVQQVAQVRCWLVRSCDRKKHGRDYTSLLSGALTVR